MGHFDTEWVINKKDGVEHMSLVNYRFTKMEPKKAHFDLQNLFNGDKLLGKIQIFRISSINCESLSCSCSGSTFQVCPQLLETFWRIFVIAPQLLSDYDNCFYISSVFRQILP